MESVNLPSGATAQLGKGDSELISECLEAFAARVDSRYRQLEPILIERIVHRLSGSPAALPPLPQL